MNECQGARSTIAQWIRPLPCTWAVQVQSLAPHSAPRAHQKSPLSTEPKVCSEHRQVTHKMSSGVPERPSSRNRVMVSLSLERTHSWRIRVFPAVHMLRYLFTAVVWGGRQVRLSGWAESLGSREARTACVSDFLSNLVKGQCGGPGRGHISGITVSVCSQGSLAPPSRVVSCQF